MPNTPECRDIEGTDDGSGAGGVATVPCVSSIEQISTDWLERVLSAAGFDDPTILGFATQRVGTGQAAICCRITLQYKNPDPRLPASIIAKFPAEDASSRNAGKEKKTYVREVNFYRYLKPKFSIQTPGCYFAQIDGDGPDFALLLEDLTPAEQGDQIGGCTPELAHSAVLGLVGMHAPSWNNTAILGLDWLAGASQPGRSKAIMQLYRDGLPYFMERCIDGLAPDEIALMRRIAEVDDYPSEYPVLRSYCLTHNDYRSDNMLIDERHMPPNMHVVDWQTLGVGNPMKDVAYFLGGCLLPDQRAALEHDLVRQYHEELVAAGVADYAWDECWSDYRRAAFHGIMTAVAAMRFVTKTERGDRLFAIMAQRHARQVLDVKADEFLQ